MHNSTVDGVRYCFSGGQGKVNKRKRTVLALQQVSATVHDRTLEECFEGELHGERACL